MKVGEVLQWTYGYKVFELKTSEGLDRFSDNKTTMKILDSANALSTVFSTALALIAL